MITHFQRTERERDGNSKYVGVQIRQSGNIIYIANRVRSPWLQRCHVADRAPITRFSAGSACRMRRYLRECTSEYRTILTLTYPHGHGYSGGQCKRDLAVFFKRFRRRYGQPIDWSAFWFMEFQKRGAVHFHILCTSEFVSKRWLSECWFEIVGSEDKRHLLAGTNVQAIKSGRHGICKYALKYAQKHAQKEVPPEFGWSGRFWGVCGCRARMSADIYVQSGSEAFSAVIRQINKLQGMINDSLSLKTLLRINVEKQTHTLFYCKCGATELKLRRQIQQIDITLRLFQPNWRVDYELDEPDISEEEVENGRRARTYSLRHATEA